MNPPACFYKGYFMKFYCCGVRYSTNDPDTYLNIERYRTKKLIKKIVGNKNVHLEDVYFLFCKKNECIKTYIYRYSTEASVRKGLLEEEIINKRKASLQFKQEQIKNLEYRSIPTPLIKLAPQSKKIPFVYGKVENSTTQRRRYINETGYADYEYINLPVSILTYH